MVDRLKLCYLASLNNYACTLVRVLVWWLACFWNFFLLRCLEASFKVRPTSTRGIFRLKVWKIYNRNVIFPAWKNCNIGKRIIGKEIPNLGIYRERFSSVVVVVEWKALLRGPGFNSSSFQEPSELASPIPHRTELSITKYKCEV